MIQAFNAAAVSKADLLKRVNDYKNEVKADATNPYQDDVLEANNFFQSQLKDAKGANLAEIKASAEACQKAEAKKANMFMFGGLGLVVAGAFIPGVAGTVASVAGIGMGLFVAQKHSYQAATAAKFDQQLGQWEKALAAASQPAPAPSQPAPAPAPAAAAAV